MGLRWLVTIGLILFTTLSLGCAQHATFRQLRPATVSTPFRRLAVIEVKPQREEGRQAYATLWSELQRSGRFKLVNQTQLQQAIHTPLVMPDGKPDVNAALFAARRSGIDGLFIIDAQFLETDGSVFGSKTVRIGDPEVLAEAAYELIDVRSGQILAKDVVKSESHKGDLDPLVRSRTGELEVLSRLAAESGDNMAHVLLPHENEIKVKLAHSTLGPGSSSVRQGIQAAQAGEWIEARQAWQAAVEADPQNDAAAYNLALAHEALGEYSMARTALNKASSENPKSLYREALARVDRADAELRLAHNANSRDFAARAR